MRKVQKSYSIEEKKLDIESEKIARDSLEIGYLKSQKLPGRDRERTRIMDRRDNEEVIKIQKKWRGREAVKNIVLLLFSVGD